MAIPLTELEHAIKCNLSFKSCQVSMAKFSQPQLYMSIIVILTHGFEVL